MSPLLPLSNDGLTQSVMSRAAATFAASANRAMQIRLAWRHAVYFCAAAAPNKFGGAMEFLAKALHN
jgi:hypothetical protein